jgi:hypothetical protein
MHVIRLAQILEPSTSVTSGLDPTQLQLLFKVLCNKLILVKQLNELSL